MRRPFPGPGLQHRFPGAVFRWLLILAGLGLSSAGHAYENDTVMVVSNRLRFAFNAEDFAYLTLHTRFVEAFKATEREIIEARIGRNIGNRQLAAAYNLHVDRRHLAGEEHRLWQQYRQVFPLARTELDFRVRVEERYFTASNRLGGRLRLVAYWNRPLSARNEIRIGNELVLNLNDYGTSARRGFSQDRLLASFMHQLANGNRVDFNYQYRYIHRPTAANVIQHQLQMMLSFNL